MPILNLDPTVLKQTSTRRGENECCTNDASLTGYTYKLLLPDKKHLLNPTGL